MIKIHPKMREEYIINFDLDTEDKEILKALTELFYPNTKYNLTNKIQEGSLYSFGDTFISNGKFTDNIDAIPIFNYEKDEIIQVEKTYLISKQQIKTYLLLNQLSDLQLGEYVSYLFHQNELKDTSNDTGTSGTTIL